MRRSTFSLLSPTLARCQVVLTSFLLHSQGRELLPCLPSQCVSSLLSEAVHETLTVLFSSLPVSPNGHVPVLVVPYSHTTDETISTKFKAISESSAITAFLDQASIRSSTHSAPSLSPATVQRSSTQKELIELVHETKVDPNDLMLGFRDEAERKKGLEGLPGGFLKGRQAALERYAKEVGESDQRLAKWYKDKIAVRPHSYLFPRSFADFFSISQENGSLIAFYEGKADSTAFQKAAADRWAATAELVKVLESKFEPNTVYLVGDQISLAESVSSFSSHRALR